MGAVRTMLHLFIESTRCWEGPSAIAFVIALLRHLHVPSRVFSKVELTLCILLAPAGTTPSSPWSCWSPLSAPWWGSASRTSAMCAACRRPSRWGGVVSLPGMLLAGQALSSGQCLQAASHQTNICSSTLVARTAAEHLMPLYSIFHLAVNCIPCAAPERVPQRAVGQAGGRRAAAGRRGVGCALR